MREKLIKLLQNIDYIFDNDKHSMRDTTEFTAEYLLSKGVVVLPCKVGDKVHLVSDGKCKEIEIENIHQWVSGQF